MKESNCIMWRDKNGSHYLQYSERTTHTGTHKNVSWTPDIEEATAINYLPTNIRKMVVPVQVKIQRIVTVLEE